MAVGEIAEVTKSAKLRMLKAQVDVVTRFERRFPKRFISRFFRQHVTLYPNQRNFYEKYTEPIFFKLFIAKYFMTYLAKSK